MIERASDDGHERRPVVAGSRRAYAVVLLLATIFIVYGSLFPFEYRERSYPGGPFAYLLSTWQDWDHAAICCPTFCSIYRSASSALSRCHRAFPGDGAR